MTTELERIIHRIVDLRLEQRLPGRMTEPLTGTVVEFYGGSQATVRLGGSSVPVPVQVPALAGVLLIGDRVLIDRGMDGSLVIDKILGRAGPRSTRLDIREFGELRDGADATGLLTLAFANGGAIFIPGIDLLIAEQGANAGGINNLYLTESLDVLCDPRARLYTDGLDNIMVDLVIPDSTDLTVRWVGGTFDQRAQKNSTVLPEIDTYPPANPGSAAICDGLSIRGPYSTTRVLGSSRMHVEGVTFVAGTHWETAGGDSGISGDIPGRITGCTFTGYRDLGIYLTADDTQRTSGPVEIDHCRFVSCFGGVAVKRGMDHFTMHHNDFEDCIRPLLVNATTAEISSTLTTSAAADDILDTSSAHEFIEGDEVRFSALTGGSGLSTQTLYHVLGTNLGSTTLQVSTQPGGAVAGWTTDITGGTLQVAGHHRGGSIHHNTGRHCKEPIFIQTADHIDIGHNVFYEAGSMLADGTTDTGYPLGVKVSGSRFNTIHDNIFAGVRKEIQDAYPTSAIMLNTHTYTDGSVTADDNIFRDNYGTGWYKMASDAGSRNLWIRNSVPDAGATSSITEQETDSTWTPALAFATAGDSSIVLSTATGRYWKRGKRVFITFRCVSSTFTHTTAAGNLRLTGLPFAANGDSNHIVGHVIGNGWTKAGYTSIGVRAISGTTRLEFTAMGSGVAVSDIGTADLPTGTQKVWGGYATYETSA